MARFTVTFEVECDTIQQARTIAFSRLDYCEQIDPEDGGPFDYQINNVVVLEGGISQGS